MAVEPSSAMVARVFCVIRGGVAPILAAWVLIAVREHDGVMAEVAAAVVRLPHFTHFRRDGLWFRV